MKKRLEERRLTMRLGYGLITCEPTPAEGIPSAARLLCADHAGSPKSLMDAVELYNPGDPTYVVAVMEVAKN